MPPDPSRRYHHSACTLPQRLIMVERAERLHSVEAWLNEACDDCSGDDLRLALLEAGGAIARALHRDGGKGACGCAVVAWSVIAALISPDADPRAAFLEWMRALLAQTDRDHPESPAERAAALIRARPDHRWTAGTLSTLAGERRRQLTLMFTGTFGVSLSEYVHLVRVERAVRLVGDISKIEAVAREVGYRSKKDFYAAMQRWIGVTPARLRAWSADDRARLAQRLATIARRGIGEDVPGGGGAQRRRLRLARTISTASVPATSAAPPTMATPV